MKRLLAKAMEQVAMEMAELAQGIPNMKKEMQNIQVTLIMQDNKLEEIKQLIRETNSGMKEEGDQREAMAD